MDSGSGNGYWFGFTGVFVSGTHGVTAYPSR
jgi:hypothetical protein